MPASRSRPWATRLVTPGLSCGAQPSTISVTARWCAQGVVQASARLPCSVMHSVIGGQGTPKSTECSITPEQRNRTPASHFLALWNIGNFHIFLQPFLIAVSGPGPKWGQPKATVTRGMQENSPESQEARHGPQARQLTRHEPSNCSQLHSRRTGTLEHSCSRTMSSRTGPELKCDEGREAHAA